MSVAAHSLLPRGLAGWAVAGLRQYASAAAAATAAQALEPRSGRAPTWCQQQQQQQQQHVQWPPQTERGVYSFIPRFRGLLVDAAGTLLIPSEPAAEVYLRYARKYGCNLSEKEVLKRFRDSYNTPWGESTIRYVGDGRPFWRHIVQESTGCCNEEMFEEIYEYYSRGDAYYVSPGAVESIQRIRENLGMRTAVVSNFDTRLWRIVKELGIGNLFDAIIISAEVRAEKPNPVIFEAACTALGLPPEQCVHVGDDRRNDLYGARDSGCFAWLWGQDVHNFAEVERRLETGNYCDSLTDV